MFRWLHLTLKGRHSAKADVTSVRSGIITAHRQECLCYGEPAEARADYIGTGIGQQKRRACTTTSLDGKLRLKHVIIRRERNLAMRVRYTKIESTKKCAARVRGLRVLAAGMALGCCGGFVPVFAQGNGGVGQSADVLRGTVVNSVTHEVVGRALVFSPDNRFATMTDERGHFEFTFARTEGEHASAFTSTFTSAFSGRSDVLSTGLPQAPQTGTDRPGQLMARKTGFLPRRGRETIQLSTEQHELTISLVPEGRIIGHVILPGADGTDSVQVDLYRRQVREGLERWEPAGNTMSRADGEFRFAELAAGSYKLFTNELPDRDPVTSNPRGQLFGYPPVYYPGASDFATAA